MEAERFARSGWHHGQDITTIQNSLDEILLTGAERRVTEMCLECGEKVDHGSVPAQSASSRTLIAFRRRCHRQGRVSTFFDGLTRRGASAATGHGAA